MPFLKTGLIYALRTQKKQKAYLDFIVVKEGQKRERTMSNIREKVKLDQVQKLKRQCIVARSQTVMCYLYSYDLSRASADVTSLTKSVDKKVVSALKHYFGN